MENKKLPLIAILVGMSFCTHAQVKMKGKVYTTAMGAKTYWNESSLPVFHDKLAQPKETDACVFIDPEHKFQRFIGFGGAITDASAEVYAKLNQQSQHELMQAYYDSANGIGYNVVRTNMGSCDFSSDSYTYIKDNDKSLKSFDISHDKQFRIPFIQQVKEKIGNNFKLFISPWSPPAWMKTNNDLLHGGALKAEFYQNWADYFVKYINALNQNHIPVWGLTVQNEPMATQKWESCVFSAEQEKTFLKYYLGPTLWKNGMKDKKVIIWDHNRDLIYQYASTILNDKEAAKYVWGTGIHWYETWTKSLPLFDNVKLMHEAFPDKSLIFTEGCKEQYDFSKINDWSLGELYGNQILNDLNNGIAAWTDWNILLDTQGGPNHVGNYCFAPIHADPATNKLYYTMEYWYIGQFSKFIRPGARRIVSSSNRDVLQTTAFQNMNGKITVVVLNRSEHDLNYNLWIKGQSCQLESKAHSIATIVF